MANEVQERQTPQYEYNDQLYDLSSLRDLAEDNFDSYINQFSNANKIKYGVWAAVNQLINGLQLDENGNSRVYYDTSKGQFVDSYGEYRNTTKHRNRTDVYGYAVAFLNKIIKKADKITPKQETPKSKLTGQAMGNAILREIAGIGYNDDPTSFGAYLDSFINLDDEIDEKGSLSNKERSLVLKGALLLIYDNFDSIFEEYDISDKDKGKWMDAIQKAIDATDEGITQKEYMTLKRLTPLNWETLLGNKQTNSKGEDLEGEDSEGGDSEGGDLGVENLDVTIGNTKFSIRSDDSYDTALNAYFDALFGTDNEEELSEDCNPAEIHKAREVRQKIEKKKLSMETLTAIISNFNDNTREWCRRVLGTSNQKIIKLAIESYFKGLGGDFLVEGTDGKTYVDTQVTTTGGASKLWGFTYDKDKKLGTFYEFDKNKRNLKKYRDKAKTTFDDYFKTNYSDIFTVWTGTPSHKHGGILKASKGNILKGEEGADFGKIDWANISPELLKELFENTNWDDGLYTYKVENGKIILIPRDPKYLSSATNGAHYAPENDLTTELLTNLENLDWYKALLMAGYYSQDYARHYAEHYKNHSTAEELKDNYKKWFKNEGDGEFDWDAFKKDMYDTSGGQIRVRDKKFWNDLLKGVGHDSGKGITYVYKDEDGNICYTKEPLDGYDADNTDIMNGEGPIAVYRLTKKSDSNDKEADTANPAEGDKNEDNDEKEDLSGLYSWFQSILDPYTGKIKGKANSTHTPIDLSEFASLPVTILGNRRAYDTAKKGLKHTLQEAPYAWNRVYGNYPAVLLANLLKALMEYLAMREATADNALNTAAYQNAVLKGNALVQQALDLDYKAITTTLDKSQETLNKNNTNRVSTANANMQSIRDTNLKQAELKTSYLKYFYDSLKNAIDKATEKNNTKKEAAKSLQLSQFETLLAQQKAQALQGWKKKLNKWKKENENEDITDWEEYDDYMKYKNRVDQATARAYNDYLGLLLGVNIPASTFDWSLYFALDKQGGKLILRRMRR